jgi:hypothetical protein
MSGDGFLDIVVVHDGLIEYYPYRGAGRCGAAVAMAGSPRFGDPRGDAGRDPRRLLAIAFDGDGYTDIVYLDSGSLRLWINQAGNGFADPRSRARRRSATLADAVQPVAEALCERIRAQARSHLRLVHSR